MKQQGALLLNMILWITLLSLWLALMANLFLAGRQGMTEQINASRAYALALGVTTKVESSPCTTSQSLSMDMQDLGLVQVTFSDTLPNLRLVRVIGYAPDGNSSRRILQRQYDCANSQVIPLTPWLEVGD